jgi:site-specific DNA-methyltransferase (adenine-specific)
MISEVFNEDCLVGMARYPDKYFELAIVDPPYGIGEDGRKTKSRCPGYVKQKNGSKLPMRAREYKSAGWDNESPSQEYFNELFRVSRKTIIWGENHMDFTQKKNSSGRIIWDKVNGDSDFSDCEIAWTDCIKSTRQIEYMWSGFIQGKSLSEGRTFIGNMNLIEKRLHPTQKPILLYKWLLTNYAKPGDKILDTHMGSQSSRIAAFNMGFDYYGWEIDKDYFDQGNKRFKELTKQIQLF